MCILRDHIHTEDGDDEIQAEKELRVIHVSNTFWCNGKARITYKCYTRKQVGVAAHSSEEVLHRCYIGVVAQQGRIRYL